MKKIMKLKIYDASYECSFSVISTCLEYSYIELYNWFIERGGVTQFDLIKQTSNINVTPQHSIKE